MRDVLAGACCATKSASTSRPSRARCTRASSDWQGADVAIATGWQTVHATLRARRAAARAPTWSTTTSPSSTRPRPSSALAADTYRYGLHCIAASPWLRDLLIERYGASADAFQLGVDHDIYRPLPGRAPHATRSIYYARHATPRRAVPIGLMALAELKRRRPDVRIVLFGTDKPLHAAFPYEHLGVLSPAQLARALLAKRPSACACR